MLSATEEQSLKQLARNFSEGGDPQECIDMLGELATNRGRDMLRSLLRVAACSHEICQDYHEKYLAETVLEYPPEDLAAEICDSIADMHTWRGTLVAHLVYRMLRSDTKWTHLWEQVRILPRVGRNSMRDVLMAVRRSFRNTDAGASRLALLFDEVLRSA